MRGCNLATLFYWFSVAWHGMVYSMALYIVWHGIVYRRRIIDHIRSDLLEDREREGERGLAGQLAGQCFFCFCLRNNKNSWPIINHIRSIRGQGEGEGEGETCLLVLVYNQLANVFFCFSSKKKAAGQLSTTFGVVEGIVYSMALYIVWHGI